MKVEIATIQDIEEIRPLALEWQEECNGEQFGLTANVKDMLADLSLLIIGETSDLFILKDDKKKVVGVLGIRCIDSPIGDQNIANEHYFYIKKDIRGIRGSMLLMGMAKRWAKDRKCSHLIMTASTLASGLHDKVCNMYQQMGMKLFETSYIALL